MRQTEKRRFVLLDRDGTINVEHHYLSRIEQVELLPRTASGLRVMRALGLGLAVITNQSGIGRGYFDEERLAAIHRRLADLLVAEGLTLDGIFHCPHVPEDNCACRKPNTALVERAAAALDFEPSACFVIGDKPCDIELGQRLGAVTLLVRTGYGATHAEAGDATPDYIVDDLYEAARIITRLMAAEGAQPHVSAARPKSDSRP